MKLLFLGVTGLMILNAQSSPDPVSLLEQARDKVIARLPPLGYSCIATLNRSYFRLQKPPAVTKPCEQISADRKKNRTQLQLFKTDRLRLQVVVTSGGELYSWAGPGGFSRNVREVVESGYIGTGGLGTHLRAIFVSPLVRFRLLDENGKDLQFAYRVPVEASNSLVKAGAGWRETGYEGSLAIDPSSLELKRLTVETDELPAETSLCESSTTIEYPPGGEGVLLPSSVRTQDLSRDATETDWVTNFSDCSEAPAKVPEILHPSLFPPDWAVPFDLVLQTPIDTATAAAGDVISARLVETIVGPSSKVSASAGAILRGRIMMMEHYLHPGPYLFARFGQYFFLIWLDFDTIEANGAVSSIHTGLVCGETLDSGHRCESASMSDHKWDRALTFRSDSPHADLVIPAGHRSKWMTGDPSSKQKNR